MVIEKNKIYEIQKIVWQRRI